MVVSVPCQGRIHKLSLLTQGSACSMLLLVNYTLYMHTLYITLCINIGLPHQALGGCTVSMTCCVQGQSCKAKVVRMMNIP